MSTFVTGVVAFGVSPKEEKPKMPTRSIFAQKKAVTPVYAPYVEMGRKAAIEGIGPPVLRDVAIDTSKIPPGLVAAALLDGYSEGALEVFRSEGVGQAALLRQLISLLHTYGSETVTKHFFESMDYGLKESTDWSCDNKELFDRVRIAGFAYGCAKRLDSSLP